MIYQRYNVAQGINLSNDGDKILRLECALILISGIHGVIIP